MLLVALRGEPGHVKGDGQQTEQEAFIEIDPESEQRRQQPGRARLRRQTVDGQHPQARKVG